MGRRKRRKFTPEQKAEAVRMARDSGLSIAQVAQNLDLTESALRHWIKQAEIDTTADPNGPLTSEEKAELRKLRREVRQLKMERDFLKKAAAFFAKESK